VRLPKIVYFLMLLMRLLEWMHVYPQLPVRMASHFDRIAGADCFF